MECLPTMFVHENVLGFPTGLLREVLHEAYDIDELFTSPTEASFPIDRNRKYCLCIRRAAARFLGFTKLA